MVISGISVAGPRLSATVEWEDNDRPKQVLWFESAAVPPTPSAEAFLVGCAAPAMRDGEKRVLVDGPVDPALLESVSEALAWLIAAYGYRDPAPVLEASHVNQRPPAPRGLHAGMLSCGVDSLAMLRLNHARYAPTHPRRIAAGIAIKGFDCVTPTQYAQLLKRARAVAQATGIELLDLDTNIGEVARWPHPTRPFAVFAPREYQACMLAAAAHVFTGHISSVSIASSGADPALAFREARGSHPLLDPLYGSFSMRVFHENGTMLRMQKLRMVADWDVGLKNLLICSNWDRTELNCGRCEKCIRTTVEFIALGKLEASPFRGASVSAAAIRAIHLKSAVGESCWEELVAPLEAAGRIDLAQAAQAVVDEYRKRKRVEAVKERAKQFDERYLGGLAVRLNRALRHP